MYDGILLTPCESMPLRSAASRHLATISAPASGTPLPIKTFFAKSCICSGGKERTLEVGPSPLTGVSYLPLEFMSVQDGVLFNHLHEFTFHQSRCQSDDGKRETASTQQHKMVDDNIHGTYY